ncbi:MAG: hypothetical protein VB861_10290 [Planctomycetaceae bacterium]
MGIRTSARVLRSSSSGSSGSVALTEAVGGHEDGQMQMTGAWTWQEV